MHWIPSPIDLFGSANLQQTPSCDPKRLIETLVVDGLHDVVERMDSKSLQGKGVMGGKKDDERHVARFDLREHFEAIHARHLHIEKNKVGAKLPDLFQRPRT